MILRLQGRIRGWNLCPISGYAVGQIELSMLSIVPCKEALYLEIRTLSYFLPSRN